MLLTIPVLTPLHTPLPDHQLHRLGASIHIELELFKELPQDGTDERDLNGLMTFRFNYPFTGLEGKAGAQQSGRPF